MPTTGCSLSYPAFFINSYWTQQRRNSDASNRSLRSQGASTRLKGGSNFSNDIDVAVFYRHTRLALLEFLSTRNQGDRLLLYEAFAFLLKAKRADIHPILAEMSASVLSSASIKKVQLGPRDMLKVSQMLTLTMNESESKVAAKSKATWRKCLFRTLLSFINLNYLPIQSDTPHHSFLDRRGSKRSLWP